MRSPFSRISPELGLMWPLIRLKVGRFAGAVRADDRMALAARDAQIEVADDARHCRSASATALIAMAAVMRDSPGRGRRRRRGPRRSAMRRQVTRAIRKPPTTRTAATAHVLGARRIEGDAEQVDDVALPLARRVARDRLDREDDAERQRQRRNQRGQIGRDHHAERSGADQRPVHHQEPRDAARREHHDADEDDAEIELPDGGDVGQFELQVGDEDRAEDRTEEIGGPADERGEQHEARLRRAEIGGVGDLEIDGGEAAGDAGEEAGEAVGEIADDVRVVADELDALRHCRAPRCRCARAACGSARTSRSPTPSPRTRSGNRPEAATRSSSRTCAAERCDRW